MISPIQKALLCLIASSGITFVTPARANHFEVASTPYDHQMQRVQPILSGRSIHSVYGPSLDAVNNWMMELRGMPYRYSHQWQTPAEVEAAGVGDCKGKAVVLYNRMQASGATNLRLVIGKRCDSDSLTHAWLEWQTKIGTLLLDPTFNWNAAVKLSNRQTYIAFYEYNGRHKYRAGGALLAHRSLASRAPAAPAHGATTTPSLRSVARYRSNSWTYDQASIDSRFFGVRPGL